MLSASSNAPESSFNDTEQDEGKKFSGSTSKVIESRKVLKGGLKRRWKAPGDQFSKHIGRFLNSGEKKDKENWNARKAERDALENVKRIERDMKAKRSDEARRKHQKLHKKAELRKENQIKGSTFQVIKNTANLKKWAKKAKKQLIKMSPEMIEKINASSSQITKVTQAYQKQIGKYLTLRVSLMTTCLNPNQLQTYLKKTRRGQIRKHVREIYLRDDITCGISDCEVCDRLENPGSLILESNAHQILIIDSSIALTQIDFLCDDVCLNNCVLATSILDTVREKSLQSYNRLRSLCRSKASDANEEEFEKEPNNSNRKFYIFPNRFCRQIHTVRNSGEKLEDFESRNLINLVKWYSDHIKKTEWQIKEASSVVLITNLKSTKRRLEKQGVEVTTLSEYVQSVSHIFPLSGEKLALFTEGSDESDEEFESNEPKKQKTSCQHPVNSTKEANQRYSAHLRLSQIESELTRGTLFKGIIRMDRNSHLSGNVECTKTGVIRVLGYKNVNRAVDGDLVAVRLIEDDKIDNDVFVLDEEDEVDEQSNTQVDEQSNTHPAAFDTNLPASAVDIPAKLQPLNRNAVKTLERQTDDALDADIEKEKMGQVVGILKRNWKEYGGTLLPLDTSQTSTFLKSDRIFKPRDPRIPDIMIKTRQSNQLDGKRLVVVIDGWDRRHRFPHGHWISILGDVGDPLTESKVILRQYDIVTREFSDDVLRCLPPASYVPSPEELSRRFDYRDKIVCSIDPPGCKDIDDALSCEVLPNGNYFVGVHIADVTHFVLPDTPIDIEAAERCTTVYLVDRRTDMLPSLLTTDLCSLVSNVDRLTFSVFWEMTPDGQIMTSHFHKAVICSKQAFTYEEAQILLDNENDTSELKKSLVRLNGIAKRLRARRFEAGALELASLETKFEIDSETHDPSDVAVYMIRDTNKLVEEFMLLANSTVAKFILEALPSFSVLRRHPPPKEEALKTLQSQLALNGFHNFSFKTSLELSNSLSQCEKPGDPFFNKLIRTLVTRCMNQAIYVCSGDVVSCSQSTSSPTSVAAIDTFTDSNPNFRHYGLAADLYTHFTSPIRRYADVLVHRLLGVALSLYPLPNQLSHSSKMTSQCDQMNLKHRNAQWASRASAEFYTYSYFKKHGASEVDALVIATKKNGIQVQIPRYGIEGLIIIDPKKVVWNPITKTLLNVNSKSGKEETIGLFDHILVRIYADNKDFRHKTVIELLGKTPKDKYQRHETIEFERANFEKECSLSLP